MLFGGLIDGSMGRWVDAIGRWAQEGRSDEGRVKTSSRMGTIHSLFDRLDLAEKCNWIDSFLAG